MAKSFSLNSVGIGHLVCLENKQRRVIPLSHFLFASQLLASELTIGDGFNCKNKLYFKKNIDARPILTKTLVL